MRTECQKRRDIEKWIPNFLVYFYPSLQLSPGAHSRAGPRPFAAEAKRVKSRFEQLPTQARESFDFESNPINCSLKQKNQNSLEKHERNQIYTNDIHNIRDTIQNSFIMKCDQIIREKIIRRGLKMTQILRFSDKDIKADM